MARYQALIHQVAQVARDRIVEGREVDDFRSQTNLPKPPVWIRNASNDLLRKIGRVTPIAPDDGIKSVQSVSTIVKIFLLCVEGEDAIARPRSAFIRSKARAVRSIHWQSTA